MDREKRNLIFAFLLISCTLSYTSCINKYEESELFGTIPSIVSNVTDEINQLDENVKDKAAFEQGISKIFEISEEAKKKIKEEGEKLVGNQIPYSIEADVKCTLTKPITIVKVDEDGTIFFEGELQTTEDIEFDKEKYPYDGGNLFSLVFVDKDGKAIDCYYPGTLRKNMASQTEKVDVRTKCPIKLNIKIKEKNAKQTAKATNIIIVNKRTSELCKNGIKEQ